MAHTETLPRPPAPYEAVRAAAKALLELAELRTPTRLGGGHVYAQREPLPGREPARYVVVRVPQMPGGLPEGHSRAVVVPVQVTVLTKRGTTPDPDGLQAAIHDLCHEALAGLGSPDRPTAEPIAHGAIGVPFQRVGAPAAVLLDVEADAHYSSALYHVTLVPL